MPIVRCREAVKKRVALRRERLKLAQELEARTEAQKAAEKEKVCYMAMIIFGHFKVMMLNVSGYNRSLY
jgi:hypothetical protein